MDLSNVYNPEFLTIEQKRNIFIAQSKPIEFTDPITSELRMIDRFCLKGVWLQPKPGKSPNFKFGGVKTAQELNKIGYENIHSIVHALYTKFLNLRGGILTAVIYDNSKPAHEQRVFEYLSDGTEKFKSRLHDYLNFKIR